MLAADPTTGGEGQRQGQMDSPRRSLTLGKGNRCRTQAGLRGLAGEADNIPAHTHTQHVHTHITHSSTHIYPSLLTHIHPSTYTHPSVHTCIHILLHTHAFDTYPHLLHACTHTSSAEVANCPLLEDSCQWVSIECLASTCVGRFWRDSLTLANIST